MTKSQENKLNWVKSEAERLAKELHRNGEIKQFTVEDCKYFLSVIVEVGDVGDEDNFIQRLVCRERAHLFIYKKGGIKYSKRNSNHSVYLKKNEGLLHIHCEQNHFMED
jgi:hypothetical protein